MLTLVFILNTLLFIYQQPIWFKETLCRELNTFRHISLHRVPTITAM